ncbi:hypothetical protein PY479_16200 [Shewanella sp. A32]|uniref:hypothetical protein n=1 Tax=Shewanella sp. A32 TaxID=3031327 RepID=UPI0023B98AF8|nr:hypothetical protein [Shewanella sp. A32]MDF0535812.1 hypothetical protein [Shewanella sp. A32]
MGLLLWVANADYHTGTKPAPHYKKKKEADHGKYFIVDSLSNRTSAPLYYLTVHVITDAPVKAIKNPALAGFFIRYRLVALFLHIFEEIAIGR